MIRIVYVSRVSRGMGPDIEAMVAAAAACNAAQRITGALIFTGLHFAQWLEGPAQTVNTLFTRIALDPRHESITCVDRSAAPSRRFPNWAMHYAGPCFSADRQVRALLNPASAAIKTRARTKLLALFDQSEGIRAAA